MNGKKNNNVRFPILFVGTMALLSMAGSLIVWTYIGEYRVAAETIAAVREGRSNPDQPPGEHHCVPDQRLGKACLVHGLEGTWVCTPSGLEMKCLINEAEFHRPGLGTWCQYSGGEVCDKVDNDCDGTVDEGINFYTDNENCGTCGKVCGADAPFCENGTCVKTYSLQTVSYDPTLPSG